MGGIPWTSKACKNCKNSKVKCDLQEPQCGRCIRRRVHCPGYEPTRFFINTSQPGSSTHTKTNFACNRAVNRMKQTKLLLAIDSGPAKCVQISSTYINLWFPMDIPHASGIDSWFGKDAWYQIFTHIQQISNKSPMLERAVTAISLVCLGKLNRDETLVEQGIWWYNSSIRRLLHMIKRNAWSEEIVFATIMFQMLELYYSPYGIGALGAHINGTNACLGRLTEAQTSTPVMKTLVRNQRRLSILGSTIESSLAPLSLGGKPAEEDTLLDELFHFFEPVSYIVSEWNTINTSSWQAAKPAFHACLDYRQKILSWYARRKHVIGVPFHQPDGPIITDQGLSNYPFGTPYSFSNFESAAVHVVYWMLLTLIEDTIQKTLSLILPGPDDEEFIYHNERSIGHAMSEFYADETCRTLPYCLTGVHGAWGLSSLTGCLTQISRPYAVLRRWEKLNYCLGIYEMASNNGMGMARGMADYILNMWTSFGSSTGKSLKLKNSEYITTPENAFENSNEDPESHALVEASKYPQRNNEPMPWRVFKFVEESPPST